MTTRARHIWLLLLLALAAPSPALAQTNTAGQTATQTAKSAPAATSVAERERTVPGGALLIVSYMVLWLLLFGFMALVWTRQRQAQQELQDLERRMDERFGLSAREDAP